MTQIRNVLRKWQPGNTVFMVTSQKTKLRSLCLRTKVTRAPCRKRTGAAVPRADNFGDLLTADHKVLNEEGVSRNNHRHAVVVQDLATQWIQSHPCKTKTSQETERSLWTLANPLKTYHGIIGLLHPIDPRQVVLRRERYAEQRKASLRCCCNQAWTKNGGRIPWNAIAICTLILDTCVVEDASLYQDILTLEF